jgi:tetratricopeptide (TPR) repeat protein
VKRLITYIASSFICILALEAYAQETVFALLKSDDVLAENYMRQHDYKTALKLYQNSQRKNNNDERRSKIGSCFYQIKEYRSAVEYFGPLYDRAVLSPQHMFEYAEALVSLGEYKRAIACYKTLSDADSHNEYLLKKIWRLNNFQYLFEDSMHYAIKALNINSGESEICPQPFKGGLVFVSNRSTPSIVEKKDGGSHQNFYCMYMAHSKLDSTVQINGAMVYGVPAIFAGELRETMNNGPASFFNNFSECVFARNVTTGGNKDKSLQLFFAKLDNGQWVITKEFPYNNSGYSLSDPTINENGSVLYFASNMNDGFGGKDIYRSEWVNGKWSKPENLGEIINTPYDECYPFLHKTELFFSSNGHAGLGGLDIFKSEITHSQFGEPHNVGYPLNSGFDDFGITIDAHDFRGYLSSNRKKGGFDDDIYEFEMDLQSYPIEVTGIAEMKEHSWTDSSHLSIMARSKIVLFDHLRQVSVYETTSNEKGEFSLRIPYFSQYVISVIDENGAEHKAVLEIPKHRKQLSSHHIVFVKDFFTPSQKHDLR